MVRIASAALFLSLLGCTGARVAEPAPTPPSDRPAPDAQASAPKRTSSSGTSAPRPTGTATASPETAPAPAPPAGPARRPGLSLDYRHGCLLSEGGQVRCWGDNGQGALGDGTETARLEPVAVLSDVARLTSHDGGHCAILDGGEVRCWGNLMGLSPTPSPQLSPAMDVALGIDGPCAVTRDGGVRCRDRDGKVTPVPGVTEARRIAAGVFHRCVLREDGTVWCWGFNSDGQLGDGTTDRREDTPAPVSGLEDAIAIEAADDSTCALRKDRTLWCWGQVVGHWHAKLPDLLVPTRMPLKDVTSLSLGRSHACAVHDGGRVSCWGKNRSGALGDGTKDDKPQPVAVVGIADAVAVAVGQDFSCATRTGGSIMCWGTNHFGELATGRVHTRPEKMAGIPKATAIGLGERRGYAMAPDGAVWGWGDNHHFTLPAAGLDDDTDAPVLLTGLTASFRQIASSHRHSCGVDDRGHVWCWGKGDERIGVHVVRRKLSRAQLGRLLAAHKNTPRSQWIAQQRARRRPRKIAGIADATLVTVGESHSCTLRASGRVACWGRNWGQIGDGTKTARPRPVAVPLPKRAVDIGSGYAHGCAALDDGSVHCWGDNLAGQIGDGTKTTRLRPVPVTGVSDVVQLALGIHHSCALRGDGEVWCWGDGEEGQLGDGATENRSSPVRVRELPPASQIVAGAAHNCARTRTGEIWCWGAGDTGQRGDGSTDNRSTPSRVIGLDDVTTLAAGRSQTCALHQSGTVSCWGAVLPKLYDRTRPAPSVIRVDR